MSGTSGLRKHGHTSAGDGGLRGTATEEFIAAGGSPETFTLAATPVGVRRVYLQGLRLASSLVGGSGADVEIDTTAADEVTVDYEFTVAPEFV